MVDNPWDLLIRSQQAALSAAAETFRLMTDAASDLPRPDEVATQVAQLAGAVTSMSGALTGTLTASMQPLQDFIARQRELADTVATLAEAQAQMSSVMASLAARHAEAVTALEQLSAPMFALVGSGSTAAKTQTPKQRDRGEARPADDGS